VVNKLTQINDSKFLDLLYTKKINYLSLTIFNQGIPLISYCNHSIWLDYYKGEYNINKPPPVQKYILSSSINVLYWDSLNLDNKTEQFIKKRNEVVSVKSNISVLYHTNSHLSVLTLGSIVGGSHLIKFLDNDTKCLSFIMNNIFYAIK
jgi:hypothetical protein